MLLSLRLLARIDGRLLRLLADDLGILLLQRLDALREVANFCDLVSIDDVLQAHRTRVIDTADDKWRSALTAEQKARIEPIVEPLLRELGYLGGGAA